MQDGDDIRNPSSAEQSVFLLRYELRLIIYGGRYRKRIPLHTMNELLLSCAICLHSPSCMLSLLYVLASFNFTFSLSSSSLLYTPLVSVLLLLPHAFLHPLTLAHSDFRRPLSFSV